MMNPNQKRFSKLSMTIVAVAVIVAIVALIYIKQHHPDAPVYNGATPSSDTGSGQDSASTGSTPSSPAASGTTAGTTSTTAPSSTPASSTPSSSSAYPKTASLAIPFTSQAPTANWDELHNEACEEASAIMANAYLTGDTAATIPATTVEDQISKLTAWEQQNYGYYLDTTTAETAKMIQDYYHLKATVVSDYSQEDIEKAIAAKEVVILPVDGQVIGNPNYKTPGPIYHMLVVRGYTGNGSTIITNDSGTRNGKNYPYAFSTLHSAGADWNHSTNTIDKGKHLAIIVSK